MIREVEKAVSERHKAFAAAHRSDQDRQAYISASRRASSVIVNVKAEAQQKTCFSLSPKANPKTIYSPLRSIAGSPSSSPNFPNCSYPRESTLIYVAYLRSHFSVSQSKILRSRARGYFSELRRATCFLCGTWTTPFLFSRPSTLVFPLKPAPFHTLFADLGNTNKSAASLFLLSNSPPSFFLPHSLWQELSSLSCSIRLQWVPGHSLLPENDAANELARRGALLAPSAIPCSCFPLIHSCLFLGLET